ncbi:DUF655 domain-containing protein [Candidatus Micrarchaeota archaeon]|nr:DUF655 domain-containing protein [Candidatus Micrarchaeota archaeon]
MFKREEYGLVLDFLPYGRADEAKKEQFVQVVGEQFFTLLEVVIKPGMTADVGERIYIGKGTRDKVDYIKSRITYAQLTNTAKRELQGMVRRIVAAREAEFVNFINHAGAINIRSHTLELLPSIGKKHLQDLLSEREKQPFTSFEDIQKRVPHLGKIEDLFINRIVEELEGISKYYLFVKMPSQSEAY